MKKVIITVIGKDRTGIIYNVSKVLAECEVNILDISQTIMSEIFTMVMIADINCAKESFDIISEKLDKAGEELGVKITVCHEDIFNAMHRI